MTDRHAGYIVTLANDIREDDAEHLVDVLRHLKGVASVQPVVLNADIYMARERVRSEIESDLHRVVTAVCRSQPIPADLFSSP